jgi:hypothetical protein
MVDINLVTLTQSTNGPNATFLGQTSSLLNSDISISGTSAVKVYPLAEVQDSFQFYTTSNSGFSNYQLSFLSNFTGISTSSTSVTFELLTNGRSTLFSNFVQVASRGVFGSSQLGSLFNNSDDMSTNYNSVIDTFENNLNTLTSQSIASSVEAINNLIISNPERFMLKYKSKVSNSITSANSVNPPSLFRNVTITNGTVTRAANVTFSISGNTTNTTQISNVTLLDSGPSGGTFDSSEQVIFTDTTAGINCSFQILSLNSTQQGELNGSGYTFTLVNSGLFAVYSNVDINTNKGQFQFNNNNSSNSSIPGNVFTGCNLSDVNSIGSGGVCTVILNSAATFSGSNPGTNAITSIYIETVGSSYTVGSLFKISNFNGSDDIEWEATDSTASQYANPVQVGIVNGTLDDSSTPTSAPFESGDKLSTNFLISNNPSQVDSNNNSISFTQISTIIFEITQS